MATRPLPPRAPEPTPREKTPRAEPARESTQQRFLEVIRSASKSPNLQNRLHVVTKKRWLRVAGIVIGILLVFLIAIPFLVNVNSFRPRIESEATNALGREVKLGNLSLSLLSGTVGIEDLRIADDPAFGKSPFITAKSLKVGVELMP